MDTKNIWKSMLVNKDFVTQLWFAGICATVSPVIEKTILKILI